MVLSGEPQCCSLPVRAVTPAGDSSQPPPAARNGNPKSPIDAAVWAESPIVTGLSVVLEGGWHYKRGFGAGKGGFALLPRGSHRGEWERLGFPQPACFWGRFVSGINLCVCTDKGQDLSSMDKCPSLEHASQHSSRSASARLPVRPPATCGTPFAACRTPLLPMKLLFPAACSFSRVQQAPGDRCKKDAKRINHWRPKCWEHTEPSTACG